MVLIGCLIILSMGFQNDLNVSINITTDAGIIMITKVGINMTTNVGRNVTTNVVIIRLRM